MTVRPSSGRKSLSVGGSCLNILTEFLTNRIERECLLMGSPLSTDLFLVYCREVYLALYFCVVYP